MSSERERLVQEQAQVEQTIASLNSRQDELAGEQTRLEQQQAQLQAQLAKATEDLSARNREIAELEGGSRPPVRSLLMSRANSRAPASS